MGGNFFLSQQYTNYMVNEVKKTYVFCDFLNDIDFFRKTVNGGCSLRKYTPVRNRSTPRLVVSHKYMGNREVETPYKSQVLWVILRRASSGDKRDLRSVRAFGR